MLLATWQFQMLGFLDSETGASCQVSWQQEVIRSAMNETHSQQWIRHCPPKATDSLWQATIQMKPGVTTQIKALDEWIHSDVVSFWCCLNYLCVKIITQLSTPFSPYVRECTKILDSGSQPLDSGSPTFWIPDSIPKWIPDSSVWIPDSNSKHLLDSAGFRILLHGGDLFTSAILSQHRCSWLLKFDQKHKHKTSQWKEQNKISKWTNFQRHPPKYHEAPLYFRNLNFYKVLYGEPCPSLGHSPYKNLITTTIFKLMALRERDREREREEEFNFFFQLEKWLFAKSEVNIHWHWDGYLGQRYIQKQWI